MDWIKPRFISFLQPNQLDAFRADAALESLLYDEYLKKQATNNSQSLAQNTDKDLLVTEITASFDFEPSNATVGFHEEDSFLCRSPCDRSEELNAPSERNETLDEYPCAATFVVEQSEKLETNTPERRVEFVGVDRVSSALEQVSSESAEPMPPQDNTTDHVRPPVLVSGESAKAVAAVNTPSPKVANSKLAELEDELDSLLSM